MQAASTIHAEHGDGASSVVDAGEDPGEDPGEDSVGASARRSRLRWASHSNDIDTTDDVAGCDRLLLLADPELGARWGVGVLCFRW